jgi:hypothetical protein
VCSHRNLTDISGVLTASIALMMVASLKRKSISTRLHGAMHRDTVKFMLDATRT